MTTRAWLARSAAALLATAAFALSASEAGARDDRHGSYARHGDGPSFRGPRYAPRHVEGGGAPRFKSGGPPAQLYDHGGNKRHAQPHPRFRPGVTFATPYGYEPNVYVPSYADNECYVWQPAMTRQGWRYMWINVCTND